MNNWGLINYNYNSSRFPWQWFYIQVDPKLVNFIFLVISNIIFIFSYFQFLRVKQIILATTLLEWALPALSQIDILKRKHTNIISKKTVNTQIYLYIYVYIFIFTPELEPNKKGYSKLAISLKQHNHATEKMDNFPSSSSSAVQEGCGLQTF